MGKKLLYLILLIPLYALSQQSEKQAPLFSQNIGKHIKIYKLKSQQAYDLKEYDRALELFDTLVKKVINGSRMDNFKLKKVSGRKIRLYDFEKPIFLITYASWCTPGVGEIPAFNDIVNEYSKEIDFVVLYWDKKEKVRKASRKYNNKVNVVYVDELENTNSNTIEAMKHSVGFPTSFFINQDKIIVDIRRGVLHPYQEEFSVSYNLNYNMFVKGVSLLKYDFENTPPETD